MAIVPLDGSLLSPSPQKLDHQSHHTLIWGSEEETWQALPITLLHTFHLKDERCPPMERQTQGRICIFVPSRIMTLRQKHASVVLSFVSGWFLHSLMKRPVLYRIGKGQNYSNCRLFKPVNLHRHKTLSTTPTTRLPATKRFPYSLLTVYPLFLTQKSVTPYSPLPFRLMRDMGKNLSGCICCRRRKKKVRYGTFLKIRSHLKRRYVTPPSAGLEVQRRTR